MSGARHHGPASGPGSISRRAFLRTLAYAGATVILGGVGATAYVTRVEPRMLEVVRVKVAIPCLPPAFEGLIMAQISDVHFGPWVDATFGHQVVDAVLASDPDVVAITGDHVSRFTEREARIVEEAYSRLAAPLGVYAIMGNHEYWTDPVGVSAAIRRSGATLLRNANTAIEHNGDTLYLAGLDDVWEGHHDLPRALAGIPRDGCAILLAHEPDFADEAARDPRVALQLSGHTHGGQVRLPLLRTPRLPRYGKKYPSGLFQVGSLQLYVNRGIGVVFPPVRLNARPEVTVLELVGGG